MKKYLSRILCLLMALALVFCFAACASDDDDDGEKKSSSGKTSSVAGTYYFYEMTMDGETIDRDFFEEYGRDYKEIYLKLNADGTGTLNSGEGDQEMEWEDGSIWPTSDPDDVAEMTVSGGKITLESDGMVMVFKK